MLLDDVASSMRPYKIPKLESVEPSLADASCSVTFHGPCIIGLLLCFFPVSLPR